MVVITWQYVTERLQKRYATLLCKKAMLYRAGKSASAEEDQTRLLAFMQRFAPYWAVETLKKADCYLNGRGN